MVPNVLPQEDGTGVGKGGGGQRGGVRVGDGERGGGVNSSPSNSTLPGHFLLCTFVREDRSTPTCLKRAARYGMCMCIHVYMLCVHVYMLCVHVYVCEVSYPVM